ncbi:MAG: hypothetical protein ACNS63_10815 [Candidatus Nitrospinota bacterium M3_3B_026]
MKALKTITLLAAALVFGPAGYAAAGENDPAEKLIFGLIDSFYSSDAETYYALSSRFKSPHYDSAEQVARQMSRRFEPREAVLEGEFGQVPVNVQLMAETVDSARIIRVEPHFEKGARTYNVAVMLTRKFQVLAAPLVLEQVVARKIYVIFKGDEPESFVDFEAPLGVSFTEGRFL